MTPKIIQTLGYLQYLEIALYAMGVGIILIAIGVWLLLKKFEKLQREVVELRARCEPQQSQQPTIGASVRRRSRKQK